MPQIPDPTGISRRVPRSRRAVSSVDTTGMGSAVSELGGALANIGGQIADKRDRYDLSVAKSKWNIARAEADSELEGDKEYETMEERYRESLSKRFDDISSGIRSSQLREAFQEQLNNDLEMSAIVVKSKAWGVEKDHHKGLLTEDLNGLREAALKANSTESIMVMQERIDASKGMGYLTDQEAATLRQKATVDYAVSRIEMAPASEREEMLSGDLGKYIPADTAKKLLDSAKRENIDDIAMSASDEWMAGELSIKQAMAEAKKIKDTEVREAAEARFKLQYHTNEKATQDEQNELYQDYASQLENGEVGYDDIPREARDKMTAAQRSNLQAIYAQLATGNQDVKTDLRVYDHLNVLLSNKDYGEARQYYLDNYSSLSPSDRKTYSKITTGSLADSTEIESFFTSKEYLKSSAKEAGVGKGDITLLQQRLDTWYQQYQLAHEGKAPSDIETQKTIDNLLMERPDTGWFSDDFMFESDASPGEMLYRDENMKNVNLVANQFRVRFGRDPTEEELARHYFSNKRKGKFDGG